MTHLKGWVFFVAVLSENRTREAGFDNASVERAVYAESEQAFFGGQKLARREAILPQGSP